MAENSNIEWTDAARDVLAERQRQITSEGWTVDHDDRHIRGELSAAAAAYAAPRREQTFSRTIWPITWGREWFKRAGRADDLHQRRRDLVKAGALILAEIERIDRIEARKAARSGDQFPGVQHG